MKKTSIFILLALLFSIGLAIFISPFASKSPDGLEKIAQDKKISAANKGDFKAPLADYTLPGINHTISTSLSGFIGTLVAFAIGLSIAFLLRKRGNNKAGA